MRIAPDPALGRGACYIMEAALFARVLALA